MYARAHPLRVSALALGVLLLAGADLSELIPGLSFVMNDPYYRIFHETHDTLALLLLIYATYKWLPAIGTLALILFVGVHVPYVGLTYRQQLPETFGLGVTFIVAYIAIRLIAELRHLYAAQTDIARTLQEALLEVPERIDGVEFAHFYSSAAKAATVGGDFYDLFRLEDGRIGMMIGDISGKGLASATLTSRVKITMRAYSEAGDPPDQVLTKTNEVVRKTFPPGMFVTTFFAVLDPASGVLEFCCAGHPPALLRHKDGAIDLLSSASPLIGPFTDSVYESAAVTMRRDDILLLYTDGITEARGHGDFFGEEGLTALFSGMEPGVSVDAIPQAIFDEVMAFSHGNLVDDIAIVALTRRPTSQRPEPA